MNNLKVCIDRTVSGERMAVLPNRMWEPGQVLKIGFLGGTPTQKARTVQQAKKWELYANIRLEVVDDPYEADCRIDFQEGQGSWSNIGRDCEQVPPNEPTMNFGWLYDDTNEDEWRRVVLHEMAHFLAAIHEHQSPASEIPWDKEAVYKLYSGPPNYWTKEDVDVNLFQTYNKSWTNFSQFDPHSIMLYSIPPELTGGKYSVGWNTDLSDNDKEFMRVMYLPRTQLEVDGPLIIGTLPKNTRRDCNVTIEKAGLYLAKVEPKDTWISISYSGQTVKFGKGQVKFGASTGQYEVHIRHEKAEEVDYKLSVETINK